MNASSRNEHMDGITPLERKSRQWKVEIGIYIYLAQDLTHHDLLKVMLANI